MTSLARFVRSVRGTDIQTHLARLGANTDALTETATTDNMLDVVLALSGDIRDRLLADIERIGAMVDEVGQAALLAVPGVRSAIEQIDGPHARAHWMFLQSDEDFRRAEEIRYADENQNAQRMWDGFVGPVAADLSNSIDVLDRFRAALAEALSLDLIHVERFERVRRRAGEPDQGIVQLTIYSEGMPEDELAFAPGPTLLNRTRKPVRETAIIYEPASGVIEVIGRQRETRQHAARIFAETLLGAKITGERLPPRRFDLLPLLEPHPFPTQPEDGIAKVKLTRITLSSPDERLTQTFQVAFGEPATMHEVLDEHYGAEDNPLQGDLYPWAARIEVQLEPEGNRKRGKKINIDLCTPNKCSLRGKTERERRLLGQHLRAWGLHHADVV